MSDNYKTLKDNIFDNILVKKNLTVLGNIVQNGIISGSSFIDATTFIVDQTDNTKRLGFDVTSGSTTGKTTILAVTQTDDRTITIPDTGNTDANIVLTEGNQSINGITTFGSAVNVRTAVDQLKLGTGFNITTISAEDSTGGRTITIPDLGDADVVLTEGAQTINGAKTFTDQSVFNGGTLTSISEGYLYSGGIASLFKNENLGGASFNGYLTSAFNTKVGTISLENGADIASGDIVTFNITNNLTGHAGIVSIEDRGGLADSSLSLRIATWNVGDSIGIQIRNDGTQASTALRVNFISFD